MIVITALNKVSKHVLPGDTFKLTISDTHSEDVIIEEEITKPTMIDYICTFRFAQEDGTVIGLHLSGFFGNSENLPKEIQEAIHMDDLSPMQRHNFLRSYGAKTIQRGAA